MADDDKIDQQMDAGLSPTEQLQYNQVIRRRALPRQTVPLFALLLAGVCIFMAVLMLGSGNWLGGGVFSLVFIPLAIYLASVVRRWRLGPTKQERRDEAARILASWDEVGDRGEGF